MRKKKPKTERCEKVFDAGGDATARHRLPKAVEKSSASSSYASSSSLFIVSVSVSIIPSHFGSSH